MVRNNLLLVIVSTRKLTGAKSNPGIELSTAADQQLQRAVETAMRHIGEIRACLARLEDQRMGNARVAVTTMFGNLERLRIHIHPRVRDSIDRARVIMDRLFHQTSQSIESLLGTFYGQVLTATSEQQITDLYRSLEQSISDLTNNRRRGAQSIKNRLVTELTEVPEPTSAPGVFMDNIIFGLNSNCDYSSDVLYERPRPRPTGPRPTGPRPTSPRPTGYLIPMRHHTAVVMEPGPDDAGFREWFESQDDPIIRCPGCPRCELEVANAIAGFRRRLIID